MTQSLLNQEPIIPALSVLPVSDGALRIASRMWGLPLASAGNHAGLLHVPTSHVYRRLAELKDAGFADSAALGWYRDVAERWWLTEETLSAAGLTEPNFHQEWGECQLLERPPLFELAYEAVASVRGLGRLIAFQWATGTALDAVAVFEEGWCALFWSGLLESETHLDHRIRSLGLDLAYWSTGNSPSWPSLLIFLTHDRWQNRLVARSVLKHRLTERTALRCAAENVNRGNWDGVRSDSSFFKPIIPMDLGGEGWDQRVKRLMGDGKDSRDLHRIMDTAAQWPGMEVNFARAALGESDRGKRATRGCKKLADDGMLERHQKGGKGFRYAVTSKGFQPMARRDGIPASDREQWARVPEWRGHPRLQAHEDGWMELMRQFASWGLEIASGTRSREHMGHAGAIVPDGMVFLINSPYGRGWHYVEYERSARWLSDALDKLSGYLATARQDNWPVLFVLWDEKAEALFQELGRQGGLRMLTTTLARLKSVGAADRQGCWSVYGQDVVIGSSDAAGA